jgi:hypothetical protein
MMKLISISSTSTTQRPNDPATHPPLWLSLEWEKRWHPDIAEPEVAFPQYAALLREYLRNLE